MEQKKRISEWYRLIADPAIREKAIANFRAQRKPDIEVYNAQAAIDSGFQWSGAPEGFEFWLKAYHYIELDATLIPLVRATPITLFQYIAKLAHEGVGISFSPVAPALARDRGGVSFTLSIRESHARVDKNFNAQFKDTGDVDLSEDILMHIINESLTEIRNLKQQSQLP